MFCYFLFPFKKPQFLEEANIHSGAFFYCATGFFFADPFLSHFPQWSVSAHAYFSHNLNMDSLPPRSTSLPSLSLLTNPLHPFPSFSSIFGVFHSLNSRFPFNLVANNWPSRTCYICPPFPSSNVTHFPGPGTIIHPHQFYSLAPTSSTRSAVSINPSKSVINQPTNHLIPFPFSDAHYVFIYYYFFPFFSDNNKCCFAIRSIHLSRAVVSSVCFVCAKKCKIQKAYNLEEDHVIKEEK